MEPTKKLSDNDFLELYHEGLMDIEIAEIMDVSVSTVNKRRRRMGLPKNKQHSRYAKVWTVSDWETGLHIMDGTIRELAEALHLAGSTLYYYARCSKYGCVCRYKMREVIR